MTEMYELEARIKEIIDELKGLCSTNGLSNQAEEERIITSIFLYKFLNDKFLYNLSQFAQELNVTVDEVLTNENDELDAFYDAYAQNVAFGYADTINYLINKVSSDKFYEEFDNALIRISNSVKNETFNIVTAEGTKKVLFEPITTAVAPSARNNFAKSIFAIISQEKFDFSNAFAHNFDFYSAIFEYLIKDYNVASGVYAEYFTPQVVSSIMAKILVEMSKKIKASEIYDPAAGSGSLILHLAHELGNDDGINRAIVYAQDISNKSTRFLRINLLLNGMTESLGNVIQGDTLLTPAHYQIEHDPSSGFKKFDYITVNPPFKMDFSSTRDQIEQKWQDTDRFLAGIPAIPNKKKGSMSIYLLFIQHVLYSLKEEGKAAIVVPTGFLTAQAGIEKKLREYIIENKILKGVISMPSNIFANTGTNVSVIFLDKANKSENAILLDVSKMGKKVKDGKNQRTVLSEEETSTIINTFIKQEEKDDFSVLVTFDQITEKNYSFSAGQYFEVKIDHINITAEEFQKKIRDYQTKLGRHFSEGKKLEEEIKKQLGGLR